MQQIELNDSTADRYLLDTPGLSLIAFYSDTCGSCRIAREQLPSVELPVDRICWINAGHNGGLVQRYEVFHLPALFLTRDGAYYGPVNTSLAAWDLQQQISLALDSYPAELP